MWCYVPSSVCFLACNGHQGFTGQLAGLLLLLTSGGILEDNLYQHNRKYNVTVAVCDIWLEEALTCQTFHAAESRHANLLARARVAILFDRIIVFHSLAPAPSSHWRVSGFVSVRRGITTTSSHNPLTVYSRFKAHMWLVLLWLQVQGDWLHFDQRISPYWTGFLTRTYASGCLVNVTVTYLLQTFRCAKNMVFRIWVMMSAHPGLMGLPRKEKGQFIFCSCLRFQVILIDIAIAKRVTIWVEMLIFAFDFQLNLFTFYLK